MQSPAHKRIACVTILTGESYLEGALVLGFSLRRSGWKEETLALVTPQIGVAAREKLAHYWDRIVEIENIPNPHPPESFGFAVYDTLFTKLRIWELEEYSRVIYLDSDMVVLGNLDELKNAPAFAAAPCMWTPDTFNAGLMSIAPSRATFNDMMSQIGSTPSHDGSDQGFLNNYFSDWFTGAAERRLPATYNLQHYIFIYGVAWNRYQPDLKVLHFTGTKPWKIRTRLGLKAVSFWVRRFTKAPRTGPTPFEIWWEMRDAERASRSALSRPTATSPAAPQTVSKA